MKSIDFSSWAKEFEKDYRTIIRYRDYNENLAEEKSPYFESISKVLQKRRYLFKEDFMNICVEKTWRPKKKYEVNSDEKIRGVTGRAISAHPNLEKQITELTHLSGVGVPVASAILTVIFPKDYCIMDYRAWGALFWTMLKPFKFKNYFDYSYALKNVRNYATLESYTFYLDRIKKLAIQNKMSPREIEMALWKFDEKKGII